MDLLDIVASLEQPSIGILALVFAGGVVTSISPCTVPAALFLIGYVGGYADKGRVHGFLLSLYFVLGLALTLAVTGAVAGWFGSLFTESSVLNYVTGGLLVFLGAHLAGIIRLPMPSALPQWSVTDGLGAFVMGIPFAFVSSPCTAPVTIAILAWVALQGKPLEGFMLMLAFGLGRSLLVWVAGSFAGVLRNWRRLDVWSGQLQRLSGYVLLSLAAWVFWRAAILNGG